MDESGVLSTSKQFLPPQPSTPGSIVTDGRQSSKRTEPGGDKQKGLRGLLLNVEKTDKAILCLSLEEEQGKT